MSDNEGNLNYLQLPIHSATGSADLTADKPQISKDSSFMILL
jgi:hypothetical protein